MNQKQLKRLLELSNIKGTSMKESEGKNFGAIELIKKAADGKTYAIVRENRNYYIKTTVTKETLKESDFNFIGGIQNKTKNQFRSFEDATSRLNLMFNDINRSYGINESVDMKTFDYVINENGEYTTYEEGMDPRIQGAASTMRKDPSRDKKDTRDKFGLGDEEQNESEEENDDTEILMDNEKEELQEKRYILKQPKPKKSEEPMDFGGEAEEEGGDFDFGGEDTGEEDTEGGDEFDFEGGEEDTEGGDDFDFEGGEEDTEGGDEFDFEGGEEGEEDTEGGDEFDFEGGEEDMEMGDEGDPIKDIQRTTGKLGQQLRDTEDISSDMQKYVVNSVLSALDLSKMDSNDKDSIINKLESDEGSSDEEIDFMDEEPQVMYQGGRTFEDDDERGGEPELEDGEEILLDYGLEDEEDYEPIPMSQVDMPIQDKGYLNIDPDVVSGNIDYMDDVAHTFPMEGIDDKNFLEKAYDWFRDKFRRKPSEEELQKFYSRVYGLDRPTSNKETDNPVVRGMLGMDDVDYMSSEYPAGYLGHLVDEDVSYMDDENNNDYVEIDGPISYMCDDDMEPCGPGVDCGEEMDEGMSEFMGAEEGTGMGSDDGESNGLGWKHGGGMSETSYMGDDYTEEDIDRMLGNDDIYGMNNPAPVKPKEKEKVPTRPSKSPFSPPERIRPGEEPRPKAEVDYMAEPAPSQEPDIAEPTTKPGTDRPTRPSKTPFTPPERIRPGEEPRPKADYDDDVTFE